MIQNQTVLKIILLGSLLYADTLTLTPPSEEPTAAEQQHFRDKNSTELAPLFLRYGGRILKGVLYIATSTEIALLSTKIFPRLLSHIPPPLLTHIQTLSAPLTVTTPFVLGTALVLAGTTLRVRAYTRLGRNFTFALALPSTLETSGIYAYVRHPSYTGALLFVAGTLLCVSDSGSLLAALGLWGTSLGKGVYTAMLGAAGAAAWAFVARTGVEDTVLRARFGKEWEAWRERTPWRLVPCIF